MVRRMTWVAIACSALFLIGSLMLTTDTGMGRLGSRMGGVDTVQLWALGVQMLFWAGVIAWGGVVACLLVLANRADQAAGEGPGPGDDSAG
jgi:hypothetical protein